MKSNSLDIHPSGAFVSPERSCLASVNKSCCPPVEHGWVRKKNPACFKPISKQPNSSDIFWSSTEKLGPKGSGLGGGIKDYTTDSS